ncbi:hypothetical protein MGMO_16c00090 [Methyloglobulus morosus KoM1]|uniref:Uncharacterized protein n=1 Tax=Methyloglobulus morosus KoM1 TaxID=1116472 RepID=V5BJV6_9GAMM|nr:hypothetical protein [Methyloglobulus morosus]ESS73575.1 hypothetical protein MGMO_16c00090 [Methyloglobulus morosus KoM1]
MKIISVFFALMMMGFGSSATASRLTSDTEQVGSHLSDVDSYTVTAFIGSGHSHVNEMFSHSHNFRSNMAFPTLALLNERTHQQDANVKNSHFDDPVMNHNRPDYGWPGNSGHAFDHSFLEGENHSWGSAHEHGDHCDNIPPVAAVPVPAAIWLFGSALMGMVGLVSRNRGSKALAA